PHRSDVLIEGLVELVAELLRRHVEAARHGRRVEIEQEHTAQDRRLLEDRGRRAADLAVADLNVVEGPIGGVDAELAVGADDRLDEHRVELADLTGRAPPGNHDMKDQLVAVDIDGAAAEAPAQDGDALRRAVALIDLQMDILMKADADIGIDRIDQRQDWIVV